MMRTDNEFKTFYELHLKPSLVALEKQRKAIISKHIISLIIYCILMIVAILGMLSLPGKDISIILTFLTEDGIFFYFYFFAIFIIMKYRHIVKIIISISYSILMIVAILWILSLPFLKCNPNAVILGIVTVFVMTALSIEIISFYIEMKSTYRARNFKHLIIRPIVSFIDENLSYDPEGKVPLKVFHSSRLFKKRVDWWSGEDYVEGTFGKIAIIFSEVNAQEEKTRTITIENEDGTFETKEETYYVTIFQGLFFEFNLNLNIEGVTFVVPAEERRQDSNIIRLMFPDSSEFARRFAIYSDNPAIAHQLVTTDFKHRLLTFHRPVYLSFIDDKLYLAISVNKDLFEAPMYQSVLNFELIKAFFEYMRISTEIVEMVKNAQLNKPSLPNSVQPNAKLTPSEQFRRFYEINLFTKLLRFKRQNPPKIDKINFKKDIISSIITFVDDKLSFEPEKQIPLEELKASGLWKKYRQLEGEDYIQGTLEHTEMKCFKVHTQGSKKTSEGLFFIFNFNLSFEGVTEVLPRTWLFSGQKSLIRGGTELNFVDLADSEFERQFVVYSNNIIDYVFSAGFKQRLLAFSHRLSLSFVNGKLYMAIVTKKDLFEAPPISNVLNFERLQELFEYLYFGKLLGEDFGLYLKNYSVILREESS
jgi:hypothetical protein